MMKSRLSVHRWYCLFVRTQAQCLTRVRYMILIRTNVQQNYAKLFALLIFKVLDIIIVKCSYTGSSLIKLPTPWFILLACVIFIIIITIIIFFIITTIIIIITAIDNTVNIFITTTIIMSIILTTINIINQIIIDLCKHYRYMSQIRNFGIR